MNRRRLTLRLPINRAGTLGTRTRRRCRMLILPLAAIATVSPVAAQSASINGSAIVAALPSSIDQAVVGTWELAAVEQHGALATFEADLEVMRCAFAADGTAEVALSVEQDLDEYARTRAFRFVTVAGQIVPETGRAMTYEPLASGELRLAAADGLVVRMRRTDLGEIAAR